MNPFDRPPTDPPVSLDPPSGPTSGGHDGPRRGRMALAALAAAGLVGGGIVVAGQLASADRPSLDDTATVEEPAPDPADEEAPDEEAPDEDGQVDVLPSIDGEIVIDDGDGDPLVLDLGKIGECLAPMLPGGPMLDGEGDGPPSMPFDEEFQQRMEEFLDQLPLDGLGDLPLDDGVRLFGDGGSMITIVGPDGVQIVDLGDGDATVTIEQHDGELSVETDGDATVGELPDLGELVPHHGRPGEDGRPGPGELDPGELGGLLPFDLDGIEACLGDSE